MYNFDHKTIFITGGTGFVGKHLIRTLNEAGAVVICYGRSKEKIEQMFGSSVIATNTFLHDNIDYIIHAACPTESDVMANNPVEVIDAIYSLSKESLELAKRTGARIAFLSSMEVYDNLDGYLTEEQHGTFDLRRSRSSYPVGKQVAELLVNSYHNEYNVNTCIIRLAQLFGPGCSPKDTRFFNFIIKKCIKNEDIVLTTSGDKWHNSCFIDDAVFYILSLLCCPTNDTFNVVNETYCGSINSIANEIIRITGSTSRLVHDIKPDTMYRPDSKYKMSSERIIKMFPSHRMETFDKAIEKTMAYLREF